MSGMPRGGTENERVVSNGAGGVEFRKQVGGVRFSLEPLSTNKGRFPVHVYLDGATTDPVVVRSGSWVGDMAFTKMRVDVGPGGGIENDYWRVYVGDEGSIETPSGAPNGETVLMSAEYTDPNEFKNLRVVQCNPYGHLLAATPPTKLSKRITSGEWTGTAIANGTHYIGPAGVTDDLTSAAVSMEDFTGLRVELFSQAAAGGVGPSIKFFVDEIDSNGKTLKEHPMGTSNDYSAAGLGGYIHIQPGAEEQTTDDHTRRVSVRPTRAVVRYVTTNVTSWQATCTLWLFR